MNRSSITAALLSCLGMAFSTGPVVLATFSLFMLPMAHEFGWGRAEISLALVLSSGCGALADPIMGRMIDSWGVRRVIIPGIAVFALANGALAFIDARIWTLYGLFALLGVSSVMCAAVPYSKIISSWFREKRGIVLGLSLGIGGGLGAVIVSQSVHFFIDEFGWRQARLLLAAVIFIIPLPAMVFLLKEPGLASRHSGVAAPALIGLSAGEARRQPAFYMIFLMIFVATMALAGTAVHLVAMLSDKGISLATATSIYAAYAVSSVFGRIVAGWFQDRFDTPRVGVPIYAIALAGLLILANTTDVATQVLGATLLGLGFGAEISLAAYWVSRYWGLRSYGEIYGFIYAAASAGAAAGPYLMGWVFDGFGSYAIALGIFQAALLLCATLNLFLRPYAFSTHDPASTRETPSKGMQTATDSL